MKTEENKQKRELSDEELKQVTGGKSKFISEISGVTIGVSQVISISVCAEGVLDENGNC